MTELIHMRARVEMAWGRLEREIGAAQAVAKRGKEAQRRADEARELESACEEAGRLLARFADERQGRVVSAIENVTSAGLSSVFGEPIALHLTQVVRARRVEMDVTVSTSDGLNTPILDARGGGLAAVTAFLLRLTILLLTNGARRLIVADEPFAHLSREYAPKMAEFLRELCERTDTQILMVSHDDSFVEEADVVVRLSTKHGEAVAHVE
jgi:DNA repair exonuclease SbcCD ATPase subunit